MNEKIETRQGPEFQAYELIKFVLNDISSLYPHLAISAVHDQGLGLGILENYDEIIKSKSSQERIKTFESILRIFRGAKLEANYLASVSVDIFSWEKKLSSEMEQAANIIIAKAKDLGADKKNVFNEKGFDFLPFYISLNFKFFKKRLKI